MSILTVPSSGIIADAAHYEQLKTAKHASILLLSDTHGGIDAVRWLFLEWDQQVDGCLFAGDGSEDILQVLDTIEKEGNPSSVKPLFVFARGNCDAGQYQLPAHIESRNSVFTVSFYQNIVIAHEHILLTHGHLACVELDRKRLVAAAVQARCGIAVYGHTHIQHFKYKHDAVCINPGSLLRPRGGSPAGFAILNIDTDETGSVVKKLIFYTLFHDGHGKFHAESGEMNTF